MKKLLIMFISMFMLLGIVGCSNNTKNETTSTETKTEVETKKAILIINGNLGDLGFFDSANRGMKRLEAELGFDIQVVETGDDESKWEPALADAAEEEADYVIAVSPSMVEPMQRIAPMYPEKKFILIDNVVDFKSADLSNVYCATFKQNEGSFLAGVAAGIAAKDNKFLGFVGGMDIPPINDFLVGYIEGALAVDPNTKIIATYPGDYYDPAKGKEHAIVLINQGVEVIFTAAGPTGLGSIEAAVEAGKIVIGVDSDQSEAYAANGDTKTAEAIVTSMLKNVGDTIFRAIQLDLEGKLTFGESESLGILEGGVGLANNKVFEKFYSEEEKKLIKEITDKVVSGEIKVSSAIGMTTEQLDELRKSVAP